MADEDERELRRLAYEEAMRRVDAIAGELTAMTDPAAIERRLRTEMEEAYEDALTRYLRRRQAPAPNDPDK